MAQLKQNERTDDETSVDIEFLLGLNGEEDDKRETYRIGDLAREFGVTLRTLRFYEDRGLLSPQRRGTTRLYSRQDRARLRLVLLAKTLGFSLTEARQLIDIYHQPDGQRKQLEVALERFEDQRLILEEQKREIEESINAMDVSLGVVRRRLAEISSD
ncbi:MAG: MerR family DNA-binding transcriptional regulator [Fulvimarina manganoxydans]|uniref:MerR family transcriptional regulator n=1 Tax=Fulvimarina manganoxydans TaxID=937218 RepID=UPI002354D9DD|nr:MerR family DNA-binding transcriptional regulator [Fulvimarina manganoxydans]MCK5931829.1 MerR family DNA-binding transcriptional regulator [Fulvimarina manganoxydans]MEE2952553.1 MerR family DNA-binding transcriptional regulator [Pseudomonadota bacterium]